MLGKGHRTRSPGHREMGPRSAVVWASARMTKLSFVQLPAGKALSVQTPGSGPVAVHPRNAGTDDFDWRISVAYVARAGPFSVFPGVDRIITLIDGPGMVLTVDGAEHRVDAPYKPFSDRKSVV